MFIKKKLKIILVIILVSLMPGYNLYLTIEQNKKHEIENVEFKKELLKIKSSINDIDLSSIESDVSTLSDDISNVQMSIDQILYR